jgi:hypothetical protein
MERRKECMHDGDWRSKTAECFGKKVDAKWNGNAAEKRCDVRRRL